MKRHFLLSLFCILVLCPQVAYTETTIYGIEIPGLHEKNKSGEYDKIIDKTLLKSGLANLKILSPAKAEKNFSNCKDCCFSPANMNEEFYDFGKDVIKTKPMGIAKIYIFTGNGQKVINNLSDLKGKKIGARLGMPYGKTFDNAGLKVEMVNTIDLNIKKLAKGRIDAFIAYVPDAYDAFKKLGIPPYPHDKDNPIAVHEDCLVCRDVPAEVINTFNKGL